MKYHLWLLIIPLLVIQYSANARMPAGDHYIIGSVQSVADKAIMKEDQLLKGAVDSLLTPLAAIDHLQLRTGSAIKRRKLQSDVFGFYAGNIDTSAFTRRGLSVFSFPIPKWARLEDMLMYRFYRTPSEAIGSDLQDVYFDNERIYVFTYSRLHYFRNGIWFSINGTAVPPFGNLAITSNPAGAKVILNGAGTGCTTPCRIESLIGGVYTVEVQLDRYKFFTKSVAVQVDSTVRASFELIEDVDTVFITGNVPYGLLLLPLPPIDKPYIVDDSIVVYDQRIRMPPGEHRLRWQSDERYVQLDTTITIPEGKVVYFDYLFKRTFGIIRLQPLPADAEVCIDRHGCSAGERIDELPSGLYRVDAFRQGFAGVHADVRVLPDTITSVTINLTQVPDGDGDGYLDSVDNCRDVYGLYNGCPGFSIGPAAKSLFGDLQEFVKNDPLMIGISLLGVVSSTPTNQKFRTFLSAFSGGKTGGVNNYKGFTALNSISVTGSGLYAAAEFGQWSAGLRYLREDTLAIDSQNCFYFDSSRGVKPVMYLPSTSVAFGVHYSRAFLNVAYALGHQWHDIVVRQIYNRKTGLFQDATWNSDWWFHQLSLDIDFHNGDKYVPALYFRLKYPFGEIRQTRWIVFTTGLQLKLLDKKKHAE